MSATTSQDPDYLDTLHQFLHLALQTAQTASAAADHRLALQAIREGAKIVALIFKMTRSPNARSGCEPDSRPTPACAPAGPATPPAAPARKRKKSEPKTAAPSLVDAISELLQKDRHSLDPAGENPPAGDQDEARDEDEDGEGPPQGWFEPYAMAYVAGKIDHETMLAYARDLPEPDLEAALEAARLAAQACGPGPAAG